jgi:hypothetical protein
VRPGMATEIAKRCESPLRRHALIFQFSYFLDIPVSTGLLHRNTCSRYAVRRRFK